MKIKHNAPLILASTSWGRQHALKSANLEFSCQKPLADEEEFKEKVSLLSLPAQAHELGRIKGEEVSLKNPDAYIICGDQVGEVNGKSFGKPRDENGVMNTLMAHCGQTLKLHSAVLLMKNGEVLWSCVDENVVKMREYTKQEAQAYANSDADLVHCAGALKIEGMGMHLTEDVQGEFYSIIGLPIHPLLTELYKRKIIEIEGN